jgi:pimeloyl-[acyl-carrier protein] methyl ester esterase
MGSAAPATVALAHDIRGQGRPLVLLHGWSFSSRAMAPLATPLSAEHRCIGVDLRGHGRSAAPPAGYDVEDHARDLAALFDHLELADAAVVGWSLGAQIALEALPALAGRVRALVLLSGTPCFTSRDGWPHGLAEASVRALAARLERRPEATLRRFAEGLFAPGELGPEALRAVAEEVLGGPPPAPHAARAGLDAFLAADQRPRLGEVRVPTLVVHGEADPICLPGAARAAAAAILGAELALMAGLGHAPHLSRPAEVVARIGAFLRGIAAT